MKKKKLLFICNAHAGKGLIKNKLVGILDIFAQAGYETTIHLTQEQGDAISAVKEKEEGFALVVCSGGDGTLDEVVTGMMQSEENIPIGYIPAGSTNDFARSLHIPIDMGKAAGIAVSGNYYACDTGSFNDDFFIYIAAFGIFTEVSYETSQEVKNVLGHMAYILNGMRKLSAIKSYHLKVKTKELDYEDDYIFGMVTNSFSVGGFKSITGKEVRLDDGLFEVTLIRRPKNALELQAILTSLVTEETDETYMHTFKTASVTMFSEEKIPWTLDGEFGGDWGKVMIKNNQKAIRIAVP
ncbi:MAG TPA: YegS/Rv2252/BmrU family lipid kinase [Lachnospiraceae bacterium]|nr:YegS/Rv2252/BmrU family lipid kinase [Lachnospiraceae bacterium]